MMIRRGSVMRCRFGNYGDKGYRKSVAVKVIDIKVGKNQVRTYLVRILGLCVVGVAHKPEVPIKDVDLFVGTTRFVGYAGQLPQQKNVETETDALVYLGYKFE